MTSSVAYVKYFDDWRTEIVEIIKAEQNDEKKINYKEKTIENELKTPDNLQNENAENIKKQDA